MAIDNNVQVRMNCGKTTINMPVRSVQLNDYGRDAVVTILHEDFDFETKYKQVEADRDIWKAKYEAAMETLKLMKGVTK